MLNNTTRGRFLVMAKWICQGFERLARLAPVRVFVTVPFILAACQALAGGYPCPQCDRLEEIVRGDEAVLEKLKANTARLGDLAGLEATHDLSNSVNLSFYKSAEADYSAAREKEKQFQETLNADRAKLLECHFKCRAKCIDEDKLKPDSQECVAGQGSGQEGSFGPTEIFGLQNIPKSVCPACERSRFVLTVASKELIRHEGIRASLQSELQAITNKMLTGKANDSAAKAYEDKLPIIQREDDLIEKSLKPLVDNLKNELTECMRSNCKTVTIVIDPTVGLPSADAAEKQAPGQPAGSQVPSACGCWLDAKTGKQVSTMPGGALYYQGGQLHSGYAATIDRDHAYNPRTGQSFARQANDCWIDAKSGKQVNAMPSAALYEDEGQLHSDYGLDGDREHAHNPKTGQNFVRGSCPPPSAAPSSAPATGARTDDQRIGGQPFWLENITPVTGNNPWNAKNPLASPGTAAAQPIVTPQPPAPQPPAPQQGCTTPQPASVTQQLACPAGQSGNITQAQTYSCVGTTWTPGAWTTTSNTCTAPPPAACSGTQPVAESQTLPCPAGQTGVITQTRSYSCVGTTWTPGAYQTVSNSCVAAPSGCATNYSSGSYACSGSCGISAATLTVTPGSATMTAASFGANSNVGFSCAGPSATSQSTTLVILGLSGHRCSLAGTSSSAFSVSCQNTSGGSCSASCSR